MVMKVVVVIKVVVVMKVVVMKVVVVKVVVVEEVKLKRQTLKWFGHMERMEESKMTRRVYVSEIEGGNVRG